MKILLSNFTFLEGGDGFVRGWWTNASGKGELISLPANGDFSDIKEMARLEIWVAEQGSVQALQADNIALTDALATAQAQPVQEITPSV